MKPSEGQFGMAALRGWVASLRGPQLVVLLLVLFTSGLLFAFVKLAGEVLEGETGAFDSALLMAFRNSSGVLLAPDWVTEAARDVTSLGSYAVLGLLLVILVAFYLIIGRRFEAVFLFVAVVAGTLLSHLLKIGFARPRPDLQGTPAVFTSSFPSGHATMSAVVFLTIGAILAAETSDRRRQGFFIGVAVLLTGVVGISRVYLGVHYPTDVVAGWCLGSAWAIASLLIGLWLQRRWGRGGPTR